MAVKHFDFAMCKAHESNNIFMRSEIYSPPS